MNALTKRAALYNVTKGKLLKGSLQSSRRFSHFHLKPGDWYWINTQNSYSYGSTFNFTFVLFNGIKFPLKVLYELYGCLWDTLRILYEIELIWIRVEKTNPTRCYWMLYCTYNLFNMFRALICPSSGARDSTCVITVYGVCALVAGGQRSGAGQQAVRPGWGKLLEHLPSLNIALIT